MTTKKSRTALMMHPRDPYKRYIVAPNTTIASSNPLTGVRYEACTLGWVVQTINYRSKQTSKTQYQKRIPKWMAEGINLLELAREGQAGMIRGFGKITGDTYVFYETFDQQEGSDS